MVAARILGVLQDSHNDTVNKLIENTRDPLKGLLDWNKDQSIFGNPSYRGANIRANNLMALGQIGEAKALPVMLDALDDPVLRGVTLGPLGQLAKSVNGANNANQLKNVHDKLVHIMSNPDNSRATRATRIGAANALFQFNGGADAIKQFIQDTKDLNFKRHAISALIANDYAVDPIQAWVWSVCTRRVLRARVPKLPLLMAAMLTRATGKPFRGV
jgi:HEAT repeat protein